MPQRPNHLSSSYTSSPLNVQQQTRNCLICWEEVPKNVPNAKTIQNSPVLLETLFRLLGVDKSATVNFANSSHECFQFCKKCVKGFQQLLKIHEKLEKIQQQLDAEVDELKKKVRVSQNHCLSQDKTVINFRTQVLATDIDNAGPGSNYSSPQKTTAAASSQSPQFLINAQTLVQPAPMLTTQTLTGTPYYWTNHQPPATIIPEPADHMTLSYLSSVQPQNVQNYQTPTPQFYLHEVQNQQQAEESREHSDDSAGDEKSGDEKSGDYDYEPNDFFKDAGRSSIKRTPKIPQRKLSCKKLWMPGESKEKFSENFQKVVTTREGLMFYEGHEIVNQPTGYVCKTCGFERIQDYVPGHVKLRLMKIHIKGIHLNAYHCDTCNKNFASNDLLRQHQSRRLGSLSVCEVCGKSVRGLEAHLWTHKNAQEKQVARALKQVPPELMRKMEERQEFQCPTCKKMFLKQDQFATHMLSSHWKNVKCEWKGCERIFSSKRSLDHHVKQKHSKHFGTQSNDADKIVQTIACLQCPKKFLNSSSLQRHTQRNHLTAAEAPFVCPICNRRYPFRMTLNKHIWDHRPAKDYVAQCEICSLKFVTENALKIHLKCQHPDAYKRFSRGRGRPKKARIEIDDPEEKSESQFDDDTEDFETPISVPTRTSLRPRTRGQVKEQSSRPPFLKLDPLPPFLLEVKDIRIISDELLSYVTQTGEFKLLSLNQREIENYFMDDDAEFAFQEGDGPEEIEVKPDIAELPLFVGYTVEISNKDFPSVTVDPDKTEAEGDGLAD